MKLPVQSKGARRTIGVFTKSKIIHSAINIGPGGRGRGDCIDQCETEHAICLRRARNGFFRYLCNLDAAICTGKCVINPDDGGDLII